MTAIAKSGCFSFGEVQDRRFPGMLPSRSPSRAGTFLLPTMSRIGFRDVVSFRGVQDCARRPRRTHPNAWNCLETLINLASVFILVSQIAVVRQSELDAGDTTEGIIRERVFESGGILVSRSRVAGGELSDCPHHGGRHLYGFLVSGRLRLEYGPKGGLVVEFEPGDFFHIPPRLVHRDVNHAKGQELAVVNVLAGSRAAVVNVEGPDEGRSRPDRPSRNAPATRGD